MNTHQSTRPGSSAHDNTSPVSHSQPPALKEQREDRGVEDFTVYRVELVRERERTHYTVSRPDEVAVLVSDYLARVDREHFVVVLLATNNEFIGLHTAHIGSLSASVVGVADTFKVAILANAAAIIVAHNHPSGNLEPSQADIKISRRLHKAGEILGIPLHDSLVVGHDGEFVSLAERKLL